MIDFVDFPFPPKPTFDFVVFSVILSVLSLISTLILICFLSSILIYVPVVYIFSLMDS